MHTQRPAPRRKTKDATTMPPDLPLPVATYVQANASLDAEEMLRPFALDAVVFDENHRRSGREEIRAWIEASTIRARAIFTPAVTRREGDVVVVEGPVAGDFPGSPIRLTFRFTLENDAIAALEIS
jgi:ketosteroid isomerase-like protein